jgi:membrane-bound inhibitor of C-type lysozyme
MMRTVIFPLLGLAALGACASATPADRPAAVLHCENGETVEAGYAGNIAIVRYKNRRHEMRVGMSGSGARYTGDGMQWWTKGFDEGTIAPLPPGEKIATEGLVTCKAGPPPASSTPSN